MTWAKFDEAALDHPKIVAAGALGELLWARSILWASRHLTDGRISPEALARLAHFPDVPGASSPEVLADRLVTVGLWEVDGTGWRVHDFLEYQPSRRRVLTTRKMRASSGRTGGDATSESRGTSEKQVQAKSQQNSSKGSSKIQAKSQQNSSKGSSKIQPRTPLRIRIRSSSEVLPGGKATRSEKAILGEKRHTGGVRGGNQTAAAGAAATAAGAAVDSGRPPNGFDPFWAVYPRKVGKQAASRAWAKLRPSNGLAERIVAAVEAQKSWPAWMREGGRFIPHPTTWLNQGRWDDEPEPVARVGTSARTANNLAAARLFAERSATGGAP